MPEQRAPNRLQSLYEKTGERASRQMLEEMMRGGNLQHRVTLSKSCAVALATIVHLSTVAVAGTGVYLLCFRSFTWLNLFFAGLCFGFAWLLRPHLGKAPKAPLSREEFPALYRVANQIAKELGYKRSINMIFVTEDFNASFGQVGWRRRPVVRLGLPLLSVLSGEERLALIAHEIAHGVNRDPLKGLFIGSAAGALFRWHLLLKPDRLTEPPTYEGLMGLAEMLVTPVFRFLMLVASAIPWFLGWLLTHLLWRERQRAEYLANSLAAQVSGTGAVISCLEKLYYSETYELVAQKLCLNTNGKGLFELLREQIRKVPAHELERLRRLEVRNSSRWDTTHPPIPFSIQVLQAHRVTTPKTQFDSEDLDRMDGELMLLQEVIEDQLKERYLSRLYY